MKTMLHEQVDKGQAIFEQLYGAEAVHAPKRYRELIDAFYTHFKGEGHVFSASGRVEVVGNHTDHNYGRVLTSSIGTDAVAVAAPNGSNLVRVISQGYGQMFEVDITKTEPVKGENMTAALIRGVVAFFQANGMKAGGFDAYMTSQVSGGSGLSSSAAFEVLMGCIMSHLFNEGQIRAEVLAQAGQFAENVYAGKPSGLLDQMGSAWGGMVTIDFKDPKHPVTETVEVDFSASGYTPVIVHPGGSHADLTNEYADITREMRQVAEFIGVEKLRQVDKADFFAALPKLYKQVDDRAILRAMHYFDENDRVEAAVKALRNQDFEAFLTCVNESGDSSWKYLQNCYVKGAQECPVAIALAKKLLAGKGAVRVHGGGFGGTILAFVPNEGVEDFTREMNRVFGENACDKLYIRPLGATKVF